MEFGFRPVQGGNCYEAALEEVQVAEAASFDSVWLTEHHGWDMSWPSPQMALAGFATATETMKLGTGIFLLPLANPVRLAGEFALLDEMSNGRAVLGVGLGYQRRDFEALSVPMDERVTRFVDNARLLKQLWTGESIDFDGKSYQLSDFQLSPSPVQDDGPPIWCGGYADAALRRAARLGDEWIPSWPDTVERITACKETYHEYLTEAGGNPAEKTDPVMRAVIVAEDHDTALERARDSIQPVIERYLDQGYTMGIPQDEFSDITDLVGNGLFVGDAETVTDQLSEFITTYDTDHLIMKVQGPGMAHDEVVESIEVLGEDVLPHLRTL